jgi:hypothetical protein
MVVEQDRRVEAMPGARVRNSIRRTHGHPGCWLQVVWMQVQMREMALAAMEAATALPERETHMR